MKRIHPFVPALAVVAALAAPCADAAVSATEAARLKTDLTPLGAERAGNKEGTIPAWTGGMAHSPSTAFISGTKRRADPFKDEKPLYTVTAKNMDQYADKLTDGVKAMLKRYPDTFRLDVYPTHRTASAPQWVYDNTFKNATRGQFVENAYAKNVYGGIPFPIPSSGAEVMWNHLLRVRPTFMRYRCHNLQVTSEGRTVLAVDGFGDIQSRYYDPSESLDSMSNGEWMFVRVTSMGPPIRAGEVFVDRENFDPDKTQAWTYLTGQRRVRRMPNPCCDTPTPPSAGVTTFDEAQMFVGRTDRFDWKIIGKKETLIPYNSNRSLTVTKDSDLVGPRHVNPDHLRWELHRTWVVEATLVPGLRHMAPRSRYYLDEDTWIIALTDRWDAKGQLWRTLFSMPFVAPDVPAVLMGAVGFYDLMGGSYFVENVAAEMNEQFVPGAKLKEAVFTPEAMAGEGVR